MRSSPSIAPAAEPDIYMVLDDYGQPLGRAWPEMDEAHTERETLLRHLMRGSTTTPSGSSASTPAQAGLRTRLTKLRLSCASAARSVVRSRRRLRASSTGTGTASIYSYRCSDAPGTSRHLPSFPKPSSS